MSVVFLLDALSLGIVVVARLHHEAGIRLTSHITEMILGVEQHLVVSDMAVVAPILYDEVGGLFRCQSVHKLFIEEEVQLLCVLEGDILVLQSVDDKSHVLGRLPVLAVGVNLLLGFGIALADILHPLRFLILCLTRAQCHHTDN